MPVNTGVDFSLEVAITKYKQKKSHVKTVKSA